MRRPTPFERDMRDLHGPDVFDGVRVRRSPAAALPPAAPKEFHWAIRVMAGAAIFPLLALLVVLAGAAVASGWIVINGIGILLGISH